MAVLDGGDAGGIVAAIFEPLQRVDQLFGDRPFAEDANDAAHRPLLPRTLAMWLIGADFKSQLTLYVLLFPPVFGLPATPLADLGGPAWTLLLLRFG